MTQGPGVAHQLTARARASWGIAAVALLVLLTLLIYEPWVDRGFDIADFSEFQPILDEYQTANNVTIQVEQGQYNEFQAKVITNLTGVTGAYDVVSLDDPWMPQFGGGEFIMNLGELMAERGAESDPDFVPELLALGDFLLAGT